ncbi:hypothetical protein I79_020414 [Cricetulus griseus]|uniref:Uncharacterized protein n=1 Tax=Cricetulus griseus TaxID=10029 RepID=G3IA00_CRIGR|nr:hypothetical protein I79_020414 [Cricetulus griseus]
MALPHREPEPGPQGRWEEAPPEVRIPVPDIKPSGMFPREGGAKPEPDCQRQASARKSKAVHPRKLGLPTRAPRLLAGARGAGRPPRLRTRRALVRKARGCFSIFDR